MQPATFIVPLLLTPLRCRWSQPLKRHVPINCLLACSPLSLPTDALQLDNQQMSKREQKQWVNIPSSTWKFGKVNIKQTKHTEHILKPDSLRSHREDFGKHAHRCQWAVDGVVSDSGARSEGPAANSGQTGGSYPATKRPKRTLLRHGVRREVRAPMKSTASPFQIIHFQRGQVDRKVRRDVQEHPRIVKKRDIPEAAAQIRGVAQGEKGHQSEFSVQATVCPHNAWFTWNAWHLRCCPGDDESRGAYDGRLGQDEWWHRWTPEISHDTPLEISVSFAIH